MQLHSDPGSRRWFEAEDKPPAYTVSELMGKSSESEQSKVYRLTNVLDNTKVQSVVVWETKRPTIELPKILKGDFNPTQQGMFVDFLQQFICPTACFSQENTVFWKWLQEEAQDSEVQQLFLSVKSRLPGSNSYVAANNPVVTFCTGSHNNTIMLGSTEAAKSAMFYLILYQGKVKFDF